MLSTNGSFISTLLAQIILKLNIVNIYVKSGFEIPKQLLRKLSTILRGYFFAASCTCVCVWTSKTDPQRRTEILRGHAEVQPGAPDAVSVPSVGCGCQGSPNYAVLVLHEHDGGNHDAGKELRLPAELHRC